MERIGRTENLGRELRQAERVTLAAAAGNVTSSSRVSGYS